MPDIFEALDAAIAKISQKSRSQFPLCPLGKTDMSAAGTPNPLETQAVPVVPVVPVGNRDIHDGNHLATPCSPPGESGDESTPQESSFKNTGTTGTTGTREELRAVQRARDFSDSGQNGNSDPEIARLAREGLLIDFETRSTADLKKVGPYVYADAWTEVWVACYAIGSGPVQVWHHGDPVPVDLQEHVLSGRPVIAHNATFERIIWNSIMTPLHHWPKPKDEQWYCTAAMAAAMALPRKLEEAAKVLGLAFQKDMIGHALMLKMSKPRRIEAAPCVFCGAAPGEEPAPDCPCREHPSFRSKIIWHDDPEQIERGTAYCIRDVETERELLTRLRSLSEFERDVWLLDQRVNRRGICVDLDLAAKAKRMIDAHLQALNVELDALTEGAVGAATQIAKLVGWLRSKGIEIPGGKLGKDQIKLLLQRDLPADCRRAIEIRREASKTSMAKLDAYIERTDTDGRIRGNLVYAGAGRTGRWSGQGAQLQNLPRPPAGIKSVGIDRVLQLIRDGGAMADLGQQGMDLVIACLRPMLLAAPAHDLIAADYNAIEARGVAWLAGAEKMLGIFRRGEDPYRDMASRVYGRSADSFSKTGPERQLGKIAVLGLGYGMGEERFKDTCDKQGVPITIEDAEKVKQIYRASNSEICRLWAELNAAAIRAVQNPRCPVPAANGRLSFLSDGAWLYLRLPSGRLLSYANPRHELVEGRFGPTLSVTFEGVNSVTHKWERQQIYGGKWCENAVQAICRDLLANAMLNLEAAGYSIVLSVHDEAVAEVPEGFGDVEAFEQIMCQLPEWASGFPVKAEGWRGKRYQK